MQFNSKKQTTQSKNWAEDLNKDFCKEVILFCCLVSQSCPSLCYPVHGIFQARIWKGLPFPPPVDLHYPRIEPTCPSLQADSSPTEPLEKPYIEIIQVAKKHISRCSKSLIIREMQVKTIIRYHLTPGRVAIIKKSTNYKCL